MTAPTPMSESSTLPKYKTACTRCRTKKLACNGGSSFAPCERCLEAGLPQLACVYTERKRPVPRSELSEEVARLKAEKLRLEAQVLQLTTENSTLEVALQTSHDQVQHLGRTMDVLLIVGPDFIPQPQPSPPPPSLSFHARNLEPITSYNDVFLAGVEEASSQ